MCLDAVWVEHDLKSLAMNCIEAMNGSLYEAMISLLPTDLSACSKFWATIVL